MESENGIAVEEEKRVIGVTTKVENIKKEEEKDCNGAEIQTKNEVSKPMVEAKDSISAAVEASRTSSANKNSKGATKVSYRTYLNYYLFKLNYRWCFQLQHVIHSRRLLLIKLTWLGNWW